MASTPAGIVCGAVCTAEFEPTTVVTLTATAEVGYTFTGWSGAITSTENPRPITMDGAKAITANFALIPPSNYPIYLPLVVR